MLAMKMEAACSSEMLLYSQKSALCSNPEDAYV
jgi:hypothetical protein